jgi:3-phenylpropionate/trans-cinnamate dioxygenase ferredoxin reductase subunit
LYNPGFFHTLQKGMLIRTCMHVVIIGNGIAGFTAAKKLRDLSDIQITLISAESEYPFARTSLMYQFMGSVRLEDTFLASTEYWRVAKIARVNAWVNKIHIEEKSILLDGGRKITYDKLILATGSKVHRPDWWQKELVGVTGLYHLADLKNLEQMVSPDLENVLIAGGGLVGVELAEMMMSRNVPVSMLVREPSYMNHLFPHKESELIGRHIASKGVQMYFNEEITALLEADGQLTHIECTGSKKFPCRLLCVATGVVPSTVLAKQAGIAVNKGILVNAYLETSVPDIYAIGDCAERISPMPGRPPVEAMWYTARDMGEQAALAILQKNTAIAPGVWFNSAAFFSLEMQLLGSIQPICDDETAQFFWQHPTKPHSVRIQYHRKTGLVQGFLSLGIRLRHQHCTHWIKNKAPLNEVVRWFSDALIRPAFSGTDYHDLFISLDKARPTLSS